ncbi:hypothetical protein ANO14919_131660 [Xylariales sp. No.14919]|nr:hypothetical protein ANO14919_131660 [Xylariales sp. No.14919]
MGDSAGETTAALRRTSSQELYSISLQHLHAYGYSTRAQAVGFTGNHRSSNAPNESAIVEGTANAKYQMSSEMKPTYENPCDVGPLPLYRWPKETADSGAKAIVPTAA